MDGVYLSAYIDQVAKPSLAAKSALASQHRQAPQTRLGQLLLGEDTQLRHSPAATALVQHCANWASATQGSITGMEATVQLAISSQAASEARVVCQWDAAQMQAAPADKHQFAVAAPPHTGDAHQQAMSSITWLGKLPASQQMQVQQLSLE